MYQFRRGGIYINTHVPFEELETKAEILKVIAHPVRLCIISGLYNEGGCIVSHMQQCLNIPQSTVSQHLSKLKAAGIIKGTKTGTEITYELVDENIEKVLGALGL